MMKLRYLAARKLIKSRVVRQKYLSGIFRRVFSVPKFQDIEDEEFCVQDYFGMKFFGNLRSMIEWEVFFFGAYDMPGIQLIQKVLKPNRGKISCVDIGANVGTHTLIMSQFAKNVYSFEPLPRNFRFLKKSVDANGLRNVKLFGFGLADRPGTANFHENTEFRFGSGSYDRRHLDAGSNPPLRLELRKGDSILSNIDDIKFIKMDIEGFEFEAIQGLGQTLQRNRPVIILEYNELTRSKFGTITSLFKCLPEDYRAVGTYLFKFERLKRLLDSEHLRLCDFDFDRSYEHLFLVPSEFPLEELIAHEV